MNTISPTSPCQGPAVRPARLRNESSFRIARALFLTIAAAALLLSVKLSGSHGGCMDDPCKCPSLGYLFECSPSRHHRHDDASGTFWAPCYGYNPTCWREWPECCESCPPPGSIIPPSVIAKPIIAVPTPAPYNNPEAAPVPPPPTVPLAPRAVQRQPAPLAPTLPAPPLPPHLPAPPAVQAPPAPSTAPAPPAAPPPSTQRVPSASRITGIRISPTDLDLAPMPPELARGTQ